LLKPDSTERVDEHLAECESCRQLAGAMTSSDPKGDDRGEHIPAFGLARWDRWSRDLTGLSRSLVLEHLQRCEQCRSQLVTLGYRAELPLLEGAESTHSPDAATRAAPPRSVPIRSARKYAWPAWGALAAAAGVAIVAYIVLHHPSSTSVPVAVTPSAVDTTPPRVNPPPAGTSDEALLALGPESSDAVSLASLVRSGEPDTTITRLQFGPAGHVAFQVPIEVATLAGNPNIDVMLVGKGGVILRRLSARRSELAPRDQRRDLLLRAGQHPLVPGDYAVVFVAKGAPQPNRFEYRVRIETAGRHE